MTATFYVGDAVTVMNTLPEKSVDLVISSPPFLALRSYLSQDHPDKALEGGSQPTPGAYIDWLLDVVEACARVLAPHGSLCFELGDTYSGSGGAGGDYAADGLREGQPAFTGSGKLANYNDARGNPDGMRDTTFSGGNTRTGGGTGWPLAKSLSLIPETFRWAMVYGHNPHTGRQTEPWRLRNVIRWVRPNPPVGALGDKFRPATSELMVFCKAKDRFFDLDAVREPFTGDGVAHGSPSPELGQTVRKSSDALNERANEAGARRMPVTMNTHSGAPPLDWWNIPLLDGDEETRYGPKPEPRNHDNPGRMLGKKAEGRGNWATFPPMTENPLGSPPLDWWNIPPGGYPGAHYAVWPPELLVKPIKAMCPEKVCRRCGEPQRRITRDRSNFDRQPELAAHIRAQREAMHITHEEVNGWFGFKEIAKNWERTDKWGAAIPSAEVWPVLKERLYLSGEEFDDLVLGERHWTEDPAEYVGGQTKPRRKGEFQGSGSATKVDGGITRVGKTLGFSDCGHDDYRPGLVLDPFAGSGTTLSVATGHGREAIGIDLDGRNAQLARERVGFFLTVEGDEESGFVKSVESPMFGAVAGDADDNQIESTMSVDESSE